MKRKSSIGFTALSLFALTIYALALRFIAVTTPESVAGDNLFRWEYARATDKNAALAGYRERIWAHNNGSVTPNVERFFAARLDSRANSSHADEINEEVAAIARFYASQGGMREGNFGQLLTERARQRLVDAILRDWQSYPEESAWRAFVFIETLRQNKNLYKARIQRSVGGNYMSSTSQIAPVATLFKAWNLRYRATPIIERPDPLSETDYFIAGL